MRILMISDVYFPRINGVSTSIQTFRNCFWQSGHHVGLIAPAYGEETADEDSIYRIQSRRVPFDPEDRMMSMTAALRLTDKLKAADYDVVHIHTPFVAHYTGLKLAARLDLPVVETYHTYFEEYLYHYIPFLPHSLLRLLARRLTVSQCGRVDEVIVPSIAMRETLETYGVAGSMYIIPTGIDLERFGGGDGRGFRVRHGIPPDRPTLVHVGRIAFEKNIDFLLHCMRRVRERVPKALLVIAGEGPASGSLRSLTEKLGLEEHVLFVGYLDRDGELLDCYSAGDAFLFASRTETQGLVLLEAMAMGVPVVSTAVMGTRDILLQGKGAVVCEEDLEEFADGVVGLLEDHKRREALGQEAARFASEWSDIAMASRLLGLYEEMVERSPAPHSNTMASRSPRAQT